MRFDKPMKSMGREAPRAEIRMEDICNKAERDEHGNISVPYENILLHLVMRYLAPRYSLDEMLDIAAQRKGMERAALEKDLAELGEIDVENIKMDVFLNSLEIGETPRDELDEISERFEEIKAAVSPEEMIAALSREEMYYTAALRMMCKHIDRHAEKE